MIKYITIKMTKNIARIKCENKIKIHVKDV